MFEKVALVYGVDSDDAGARHHVSVDSAATL